jgi:hypothetical protein
MLFFFPTTPSIKTLTTKIDEKYKRNPESRRGKRVERRNETEIAKGKRRKRRKRRKRIQLKREGRK